MKTYLKYILAPTALAIAMTGCFDLASPASDADESVTATVTTAIARESGSLGCKFTDRKTMRVIDNAHGVVMKIGIDHATRTNTFAIHMPENNQRFMACDLPEEMQKDGIPVIFSGNEKEIFPYERWMATPFELTSIKLNVIRQIDDK